MNIPSKFKLVNYTWSVVMHPGPINEDGDTCHGTCCFNTRTITLDATLDPELLWHTWLHELLHAILNALGRPGLNEDEGLVDSVSGALAQVYPGSNEQFALELAK